MGVCLRSALPIQAHDNGSTRRGLLFPIRQDDFFRSTFLSTSTHQFFNMETCTVLRTHFVRFYCPLIIIQIQIIAHLDSSQARLHFCINIFLATPNSFRTRYTQSLPHNELLRDGHRCWLERAIAKNSSALNVPSLSASAVAKVESNSSAVTSGHRRRSTFAVSSFDSRPSPLESWTLKIKRIAPSNPSVPCSFN